MCCVHLLSPFTGSIAGAAAPCGRPRAAADQRTFLLPAHRTPDRNAWLSPHHPAPPLTACPQPNPPVVTLLSHGQRPPAPIPTGTMALCAGWRCYGLGFSYCRGLGG